MEVIEKADPDIIFIGENHFDNNTSDYIATHLQLLESMGFQSFFLEHLESDQQNNIDQIYRKQPVNNSMTLELLKESKWGYSNRKYQTITKNIMGSSIKAYGLDRRSDLKSVDDPDERMALRDLHMFQVVKKHIEQNPESKIILLNGSSHSYINRQLPSPTVYQRIKEYFPNKKTLNLKVDYYKDFTPQRLGLAKKHNMLEKQCQSGFFLFQDSQDSSFDYYIFKDFKRFFPIGNYGHTSA